MKKKTIIGLVSVVIFLAQAACGIGGSTAATDPPAPTTNMDALIAAGIAQTQTAEQLLNPNVPGDTPDAPVGMPTNTVEVVIAAIATTETISTVQGTVNYGANCRSGPGASFPVTEVLAEGTQVEITGTSKDTVDDVWWQVTGPSSPECWLINAALTISGDTSGVAILVSPATPTPEPPPNWSGTWTIWVRGTTDGATEDTLGTIVITHTGTVMNGSFTMWEMAFTIDGSVSADGLVFNGFMRRAGSIWPMVLKRDPNNLNIFRGSWWNEGATNADGGFCGATNGAGKPSPCKVH